MQGRLRCVVAACVMLAGGLAVPAGALAAPGAPAALVAPSPTNQKPSLSWAAPTNPGTGVTGYNVYRGTTKLTATPITGRSYVDTTIPAQGSQTYTVRAVDGTGEGPDSNAVTVLYDTTPPAAPSGLNGTTPTRTAPVLTWNAATDTGSGVDHYTVLRSNSPLPDTTALTFTDATIAVSGSTSYTVRAVDAAGNISPPSAAKSIVFDVLAPTAPSLSAPAAAATAPVLTWTAATDAGGSAVARYDVYRDGVYAGTPTPATALTFTDTGAGGAGSYQYVVYAVDGAGNRSPASNQRTVVIDVTPPGTPGAATAPSPTNAKPVITFGAATDTAGGSGVTLYRVYRGSTLAGTTATTTFTDAAAPGNTTTVYTVRAVDAAGNEGSASPSVTVVYDTAPPTVPAGLAGTTPTNVKPALTWTAATDTLAGVARYDVYRGATLAGSTTGLSFTDAGLSAEGSQSYTVKAVDAAGNVSGASTTKVIVHDVTPPAATTLSAPAATNGAPVLTWTAVTDTGGSSLNRYEVYRDGVLIGSPPGVGLTFTDASPLSEGSYVYTVKGVDGAGNRAPGSNAKTVVVDVTAPGVPGAIAASTPTNAKPALAWTAADDGSGSGVQRYEVYRGATLAGTSAIPAFSDTGAAANSTLAYTVRAVDNAGNVGSFTAAKTVVYDTLAPPVPTALTGATPTSTAPVLSWTSGGADNLSGLASYVLLRGTTTVGTTSGLTLTDSAVPGTGSQSYSVKAVDQAGNVSAASTTKAIVYDPLTPAAPGKPTIPGPTIHPALTWTAATDAGGSNVARYEVLRGGQLAGSSTGTSFTDPANLADGTYSYTVVAVDGADNRSVPSPSSTVTVDATPPTAPTALAGQALTSAKPSLSWAPSVDTVGGSGVARYNVYRGPVLAGSSTGTTFTDNAVTINGTYAYTVRAQDVAGNEGPPSDPLDVTWDSTPPPAPRDLLAPSPTGAAPTLSWSSGGAASDFDHYDVFRGSTRLGATAGTTWTDTTAGSSGSYSYTVKAIDALGNASAASAARVVMYDVVAPGAPSSLTIPTPTRQPVLTWTAATDVGGSGLAGYEVYRDATLLTTTTLLSFTDAAAPDGVFTYTVRAVDGAANRGTPSPARTVQLDRTPPDAPTGLAAPTPAVAPRLTWSATSDAGTGGSGVAKYRVYRNGVPIGEASSPSYVDASAPPDDTYLYSVAAVDGAGNEGLPSSTVPVLVDGTPPPVPLSLSVAALAITRPVLTWVSGGADALSGFDHYEVLRNGAVVGQTTTETFTDAALPQNGSYTYAVRAVDVAGAASAPSISRAAIWDNTPPEVPVALAVPSPTNRPTLTWAASTDTGGAGGVTYRVLRDGTLLGTTSSTTFVDTDALPDGAVSYRIVALDAAANTSGPSDPRPVTVDTTPPPQVGTVNGDSPTNRPTLTWSAVSDNSGIARYDVYRSGRLVGSPTTPLFADGGLAADAQYAYTIAAVDNAGNVGLASAPLDVIWDRTAPKAPTQAVAATPTHDIPALSWSSGGVDNLAGFSHYTIYRDGLPIGVSTTTSFLDTEIVESGLHVYTVRTTDNAGNVSTPSPPQNVVYDILSPPTPENVTLPGPTNLPTLSWTASNDDSTGGSGVIGYRVYRDGSIAAVVGSPSYIDASLTASGSHAYWITALDAVGNESVSSPTQVVYVDLDPPSVPADLVAASPAVRPSLSWTAASDQTSGNSGVDHYDVYRDGILIGRTTGTSYADSRVVVSGRVTYTVRAVDGAGNVGAVSNSAVVDVDVTGPELSDLYVPRRKTVGENVIFSVRTRDPQGSIVAPPRWTFGDGGADGTTVSHVFQTPGTYQISVSASDALGNTTTGPPTAIEIMPRLTQAQLQAATTLHLPKLKKSGWLVRGTVTVDEPCTIVLSLLRGKTILAAQRRKLADGRTGIGFKLPAKARKVGSYTLRLTVDGSGLKAQRTVRVLRK